MMQRDKLGPSLFYTDNVKSDEAVLLSYFPNSLDPGTVIEDPFHLLLGYSSQISSHHPLKREFLAEMTNAFFVREANDAWLDDEANRANFESWKVMNICGARPKSDSASSNHKRLTGTNGGGFAEGQAVRRPQITAQRRFFQGECAAVDA